MEDAYIIIRIALSKRFNPSNKKKAALCLGGKNKITAYKTSLSEQIYRLQ